MELVHRVAMRLRAEPELVQFARDNIARWLLRNADAPGLVRGYNEWKGILERPVEEICTVLESIAQEGFRLRQNSPFAGVLPPSEVWSIKSTIRERHAKSAA